MGGYLGAGIGGGRNSSGGNITISGGMVSAQGGFCGAGIGGGWGGSSGTITISGGIIESAQGGSSGAGIGGGEGGNGGTITISDNSVVFATGGSGSTDHVGAGNGQTDKTVNVDQSIVVSGTYGQMCGSGATINQNVTIPGGTTIKVGDGQTLTVADGVTLTNDGTIKVDGTLDKKGDIVNNGTIDARDGAITGSGTISGGGTVYYPEYDLTISIDGVTLNADTDYTVTVNGVDKTIRTDAHGVLTVPDVAGGETTISLSHGSKTYEGTAEISGDGTFTLTENAGPPDPPYPPDPPDPPDPPGPPTPGHGGIVVLPGGATFPPETDIAVNIDGSDTTSRTDGDGNLVLPNLSDGNHTIKLEHDGKDYEGIVTVGGGNVTVDIWEVLPPGPAEGAIRFQIGASAGETLDFVVRDMDCAGIGHRRPLRRDPTSSRRRPGRHQKCHRHRVHPKGLYRRLA